MQLVLEELGLAHSVLKQKITTGAKDIVVEYIRPHLYKHLSPAGSLTVSIKDATDTTTIATSDTVTISSFDTANYVHGKVRFAIKAKLLKNTSYYICLNSSGYTYAANAFIGWCNDYDLAIVSKDYTPTSSLTCAFLFELWETKKIDKGRIS